ncbi:hypothetical protein ATO10_12429 [Actibacterium atlanticum]|uniref:DUF58 domain-containing protein n=1 Tax=Actibacterium atlanticum TaxID=1461693 RepID=A0A058ZIL7_9RHOB|nr:DUF58 domain-containing protein [Actibacterium atlanticum]KCV81413.1 hypothetical protein ATO10_12429 [Actibacterium atlanticum]
MSTAATLRARSEALAAQLPPLLAEAEHLAMTILMGEHGRRRSGQGEEFWQYRHAQPGDPAHRIDWRRSARSDQHFVREKEWQAAQSVTLWVDDAQSMQFEGDGSHGSKAERAQVLALALAVLLVRGGERVGLSGFSLPPRRGALQLLRLAEAFSNADHSADFGSPEARGMLPHSRTAFISDFMGDLAPVEAAMAKAADRGVKGVLLQVLDPSEEAFPFDGRTIFESMGGSLRHETLKAGDLRDRYLQRLADRKSRLAELAQISGWHFQCHHTGESAQAALLWMYGALERGR